MEFKEKYTPARCCKPEPEAAITGYFSFDDHIKVHRSDCPNLDKAEANRLVPLKWNDILAEVAFEPAADYQELDRTDFDILKHHHDLDIDYSLKVARSLGLEKEAAFEHHQKLRNLGLLERVEALMVQYRKKTAKNKWIKHRNHTYYRLTPKGSSYLEFHRREKGGS